MAAKLFGNPKNIKKRLNEITRKDRINRLRHRGGIEGNADDSNNTHNHNHNQNHKNRLNPKKQHRAIWRGKKGGAQYYVGLDGQNYEGATARRQCFADKQKLRKLAETKRQIQSPTLQITFHASDDDDDDDDDEHEQADEEQDEAEDGGRATSDMRCQLQYWRMPREVIDNYAVCGIHTLYEWQAQCLSMVVSTGTGDTDQHLLYCAPTSGGKTLVAEILMIRRILLHRQKCMFILPFISLANEKANDLKRKLSSLGVVVEAYHSTLSLASVDDADILCCTIEKANAIVNKLMLEQGMMARVGCIVLDEFHYVGDGHRGCIIEMLLAKILFLIEHHSMRIQLVAMSATLASESLAQLAQWLHAKLFVHHIRPITLSQYYKHDNVLYDTHGTEVRRLPLRHPHHNALDTQHVVTLCKETTVEGGSVLVFCAKKVWCKTCCHMIADCLSKEPPTTTTNATNCKQETQRNILIEQLRELPLPLCETLQMSIVHGVAYHHAGLTLEQRQLIETGFRKNVILILVATSTLAAGVNLPARRVIFRTPKVGRDYIDASKYKQMSGRAGRKGIDRYGESIVICADRQQMQYVRDALMNAPLQAIRSQILCNAGDDDDSERTKKKNAHNMQRLILEGFATNLIRTRSDVRNYAMQCLQCVQVDDETVWNAECESALQWLLEKEFVRKKEDTFMGEDDGDADDGDMNYKLEITALGHSCIGSGLDPIHALYVFEEIAKTRHTGVCLQNALFLCYLCAPIRNDGGNIEPNWDRFYDVFCVLSADKKRVAHHIGISERMLGEYARQRSRRPTDHKQHIKLKRFYAALILDKMIEEKPLSEIERKFGLDAGKMQSLQSSAATFASALSVFCQKLNWTCMAQIIAHHSQRINFGVSTQLVPLMKIANMQAFRARILYENGLQSIEDIVKSTLETLVLALSRYKKFRRENDIHQKLVFQTAQSIKYEAHAIYTRQQTLLEQQEHDDDDSNGE